MRPAPAAQRRQPRKRHAEVLEGERAERRAGSARREEKALRGGVALAKGEPVGLPEEEERLDVELLEPELHVLVVVEVGVQQPQPLRDDGLEQLLRLCVCAYVCVDVLK